MLRTANAQALHVSKCILSRNFPTKRLASLTGAIEKGARKSKTVWERKGQDSPRPDQRIKNPWENSRPRKGEPSREFEQPYRRRQDSSEQSYNRKKDFPENPYRRKQDFSEQRPRYNDDSEDQWKYKTAEREQRSGYKTTERGRRRGGGWRRNGDEVDRGRFDRDTTRDHRQSRHSQGPSRAAPRDYDQEEPKAYQRQAKPGGWVNHGDQRNSQRPEYSRRDLPDDKATRPPAGRRFLAKEQRGAYSRRPDSHSSTNSQRREAFEDDIAESSEEQIPDDRYGGVPVPIPRTTAASEFLYGTSSITAALQAGRRKLYKLYIQREPHGAEKLEENETIVELASEARLKVERVAPGRKRVLDAMAQARPHNGYVLEASTLPITPTKGLGEVTKAGEPIMIEAEHQSAEELAVNGRSDQIWTSSRRYPFVLMLDSILDPGNLGAIIRTAAFFGVDAIAVVDYNLAPFSPVTVKASAGAAEYMQFLKIRRDLDWVKKSQSNGWKFFAAVSPHSVSSVERPDNPQRVNLKAAEEALATGPCVLMVGGEGEGLRPRLQKAADATVAIEGADGVDSEMGLDSLNVSVAAALVIQSFVKRFNHPADGAGLEADQSINKERLF